MAARRPVFALVFVLPMFLAGLSSCGQGGSVARFGGDLYPDGVTDTAPENVGPADAGDLAETTGDAGTELDVSGPPDLGHPEALADLPELTTPDADGDLTEDIAAEVEADVVPETGCRPMCQAEQVCLAGRCYDSALCVEDFCGGGPQGMVRVQVQTLGWSYVDAFEFPGVAGQVPISGLSLSEAGQRCSAAGKRLCSSSELAAACTAGGTGPYPYGSSYDPHACKTEFPFSVEPSGKYKDCRSADAPVFDLVGNLAEWDSVGGLFGGSFLDGLAAVCDVKSSGGVPLSSIGFRCCVAPDDDMDGDGIQASLDCDDSNPEVNPAVTEKCDGLDNDCNGGVDDLEDKDKDGYSVCTDCNDLLYSINPGATDLVGDGVDLNCDGVDGEDRDADGFMSLASGGDDCADLDPAVNPGAVEVCNGLDDNCDGAIDGPAELCDDKNACTTDLCTGKQGCEHLAKTGPCNDGNGCTLDDRCQEGTCKGSPCADSGLECWLDKCVACAPKCQGKDCGSDSCGGVCGQCKAGRACSTSGLCLLKNLRPVPAGTFWMGCDPAVDGYCQADEQPAHQVLLDDFMIEKTEVTQAAYRQCVEENVCSKPFCDWYPADKGNTPVVCVNWSHAKVYCEWAGARLPTEAEWEKAARGVEGGIFPWGDEHPTCLYTVMKESEIGCGTYSKWDVCSKPAGLSPYGLCDMAGNVWEWVSDWYGAGYYQSAQSTNPKGPENGTVRVIRGGSWDDTEALLRATARGKRNPTEKSYGIGFRCARSGLACIPSCEGRECGSDGCTGSCGDCETGMTCVQGQSFSKCARTPAVGELIVTEILIDTSVCKPAERDWFEVFNTTGRRLDLSGCVISDTANTIAVLAAGTVVEAKDYLVFVQDLQGSTLNLGTQKVYFYGTTPNLNDSGDSLKMTCGGQVVMSFKVGGVGGLPLPAIKSGRKASVQLSMTGTTLPTREQAEKPENWCLSAVIMGCGDVGTPGSQNMSCQ